MAKTEESKSNDRHSNFNKHKNKPFNKEDFYFKYRQMLTIGRNDTKHLEVHTTHPKYAFKHSEAQNRRSFTPLGTIWNCKAETSNKDTSQILAQVKRIQGCSLDQN